MYDLAPAQARFVEEYLIDLNGKQAAIRAGYSPATAEQQASRLLRNVKVASVVAALMEERSERTKITQDAVLKELWAIGTADANELVEYRRTCCRYCWGEEFRWQFTQQERDSAYAAWEANEEATHEFDEKGGVGYDARIEPNGECPECFGEGLGHVFVKDTRTLPPSAKRLYAGAKITKDGIEIKMHDKASALVNIGKHLGLFTDKLEISMDESLANRLNSASKRVSGS